MSQTYISAKEPYISAPETNRRKIVAWTSAVAADLVIYIFTKEPYIFTNEPYIFTNEPYLFTNEPYISTKEHYGPTQELYVLHQRDVYLRK